MASADRVTVGVAVVQLNIPGGTGGVVLTVKNLDATNAVDLGGSDVAAGLGFALRPDESVVVHVDSREGLYAVRSGAADAQLAILRS